MINYEKRLLEEIVSQIADTAGELGHEVKLFGIEPSPESDNAIYENIEVISAGPTTNSVTIHITNRAQYRLTMEELPDPDKKEEAPVIKYYDPAACRRKEDQHWEMAGLARQDHDTKDEIRHTQLAQLWASRGQDGGWRGTYQEQLAEEEAWTKEEAD